MPITLIDTHAHLDHLEDLPNALQQAYEAGVKGIITVGVDLASNKKNLEIKRKFSKPEIFLALGIHPGNIKTEEIEECLEFIRSNIQEAIAIGEIGLDFWYKWVRKDKAKKDEQRKIFRQQLMLAKEFNLPAIVHTRGTWKESLELTKEVGLTKALFHWYSGPVDVLRDILKEGYFVSCSPSLAYSPQSREAIEHAPIEHTLIETDTPVFYHYQDAQAGFQSTPKDVLKTLKAYCELKNINEAEAVSVLNANAKRFFNIESARGL